MEASTDETTADSVSMDHDQQEETNSIISTPLHESVTDYPTAPGLSTLGSTTSRFISTATLSSERSTTVRRASSHRASSETSAAPTAPHRTTTEYPQPPNLGQIQIASPSHPMSTATTNAAVNATAASETATYSSISQQITTGASSASLDHPGVNTTTIAGGVAGGLGLLILVLLVKVYIRQRKIIKERDILMMSMYLTPRQTPLKKRRFKYAASEDQENKKGEVTEQERNSYLEPLVHRQIWQQLDRRPFLPRRTEETQNEQEMMYSSIRISENTAQRLQYIARCMGPKDAASKKQSTTSTLLQTFADANSVSVQAPVSKKLELDHGRRWSTDTNHYEFVEGSKVDETEAEDTVIYDDVIIEQTERLRYSKPPKVADNFNARMIRSRSSEIVSAECGCTNQKRLYTAPRNSTVDIRASVIDNVKPFTYKLVGEMKLVTNEG